MALQTHYRTCNLCEAMCGLVITHNKKEIHSIKGDADDPFSKGFICPKAVALQDIYNDADRLKKPVKKTDKGFVEISWEEAFDTIEQKLKPIVAKYGPDAFASYLGNPNVHNAGTLLFGPRFSRTIRTKNKFSATSVDQLPHHFASQFMFGHLFMIPIPDIDHTDFFLVMGANPMVSNGSLMTAGGMPTRIKELRARGGKMVVVDPRKTETARKADQHIFIKPGTDVLLLLSILQVLYADRVIKPTHLSAFTDGLEEIPALVAGYTPEFVSAHSGIDAATIVQLAHDFAKASKAVCYGRMGVSVQEFGGLCQWLINVLNIVTGNMDRPGGAMFTKPAIDILKNDAPKGTLKKFNRWQSRVSGLPEFGSELPVVAMAEEMLTEGDGKVRAFFTSAGNPVLSTPDGEQVDKALAQLDFMFSVDIYINETTRHADIILPPATGLETDHFDLVFNVFAVRNTVKYSPALMPLEKDQKYDWEIFKELAMRFQDPENPMVQATETPKQLIDLGLKYGPYGKSHGLDLEKLEAAVHGIDLGALIPCLPERLFTEDKRINLTPEILTADLARVKAHFSESRKRKPNELLLIGRRDLRSNNSWMHNSHRLVKGPKRCTLMIHPNDAKHLQLNDDTQVTISSRVGSVTAPIEITEEVMPGVVSLPHGWGHNKKGVRQQTAAAHAGVNANALTDTRFLDALTGNAALNGVLVLLSKN